MLQEIVANSKELDLLVPVWGKQKKIPNTASNYNGDNENTEYVDLGALTNWFQKVGELSFQYGI